MGIGKEKVEEDAKSSYTNLQMVFIDRVDLKTRAGKPVLR
jgi:hypothetical protein